MEPYVACDVDQIPVSNAKWSERPSANGMEKVAELLALIDQRRLDGVIVAINFTFRWC
jgi:sulfur carrier protein ThiS